MNDFSESVPLGVPTIMAGDFDSLLFSVAKPSWRVVAGEDCSMDIVRELRTSLQKKPWQGEHRIFIASAERMGSAVWNVLLKVLEELPAEARFVIHSSNSASLPDTIVSRCFVKYLPVRLEAPSMSQGSALLVKAVVLGDPRVVWEASNKVESPVDVYAFVDWGSTWASPEFTEYLHSLRDLVRTGARPVYAGVTAALRAIPQYKRAQVDS